MATTKNCTPRAPYVLGIDLGTGSVGWAALGLSSETPESVLCAGSHTFEAGAEGDIESGRDKPRGGARRDARQTRRQIWRRQRRRTRLLTLLQRHGLLPPGEIGTPEAAHQFLQNLDQGLREKHLPYVDEESPRKFRSSANRLPSHVLPYLLRAKALDHRLDLHELGRALYHLAQRRGFLSNRKTQRTDEDEGKVDKGISELHTLMDTAGARTLGEYFAGLDPEAERIRGRWTAREMYLDEFERIWEEQAQHHPDTLTLELKRQVHRTIFFQRPLKSQRGLIGRCELFPLSRRAPLADRTAQRFRLLQKVNDLLIHSPDNTSRGLTPQERATLLARLERQAEMKFSAIRARKCLHLAKGVTFNFEDGGEKALLGHRTDMKMRAVFGDAWDRHSECERDAIVQEVLSFERPDALKRRARKAWGLAEDQADKLAKTRFEPGYARHSRKAMRILVERMKDGTQYATARKEAFPALKEDRPEWDVLPPVCKAVGMLRNPVVERALTELRKIVNAMIRRHGKPVKIRVELARDLKRARKERERISKDIEAQRGRRERAKAEILAQAGIAEASRSDVEKYMLAEECGWQCPYTGKQIEWSTLFGANPQFDVEHILPLSRSLDNSFVNKTLCYHEENRTRKGKRTPWDAYSADPGRYAEILERVGKFQGRLARIKRERFEMQEISEEFASRQLNDTRYASRLAADYLGLLYGGRTDASGTQRVQVSTGGLTAHLRNEWLLNGILDDGGRKTRDDHRHHAVDAIVIALTSPAAVSKLQQAAERASDEGRRLFARVAEPCPGSSDKRGTRC